MHIKATRWFSRYKEASLNDSDEAKEWLEDAMDKMYVAFARSNFQQEIFENYHDLLLWYFLFIYRRGPRRYC